MGGEFAKIAPVWSILPIKWLFNVLKRNIAPKKMSKKNAGEVKKILFLNVFLLYLYSENDFRTGFYARPARFYAGIRHSESFGKNRPIWSIRRNCSKVCLPVQCSEN
jgi:hypothetical protein